MKAVLHAPVILSLPSPPSLTYFPAENLTEYKWPPDDTGEYYMLQEQVSEYLGVTSFKRKYPGKNTVKKQNNTI